MTQQLIHELGQPDRPDDYRWQELCVPLIFVATLAAVLLLCWWIYSYAGAVDGMALAGRG